MRFYLRNVSGSNVMHTTSTIVPIASNNNPAKKYLVLLACGVFSSAFSPLMNLATGEHLQDVDPDPLTVYTGEYTVLRPIKASDHSCARQPTSGSAFHSVSQAGC